MQAYITALTITLSACFFAGCATEYHVSTGGLDDNSGTESKPVTVACYYFPNYHPSDARNQKLKGCGWSEWELVKEANPRFKSHHQPNVPLWGYTDESDPKQMAQKIAAAADHGVDAFIFDWYWFDDGPFLERGLDNGFLKAPNNDRIKFSLMWTNHDWIDVHPYKKGSERKVLYKGAIKKKTFDQVCEHVIKKYFKHPSYWKIDGNPYFSIYELNKLMESFGSIEATRKALDEFRGKAKAAGLPGIHLDAVVWGRSILAGEKKPADPADVVKRLGFDSVTSYVWIHHVALPEMQTDYKYVQDEYFKYWTKAESMFDVPYYPNVTMGWDSSPRAHQDDPYGHFGYPFMNTISGNTPERFEQALLETKRRLEKDQGPRILTINCWNEWTEGSYLEPDTRNKMAYLQAVKRVFEDTPNKEPVALPGMQAKPYVIGAAPSHITLSPKALFESDAEWATVARQIDLYKYYGVQLIKDVKWATQLDPKALVDFTKARSIKLGCEFGDFNFIKDAKDASEHAFRQLDPIFEVGGEVSSIHLDGPVRHMLKGHQESPNALSLNEVAVRMVRFFKQIRRKYPNIRIGIITNFPNWDYTADLVGYNGHYTDRSGVTYSEVLDVLHRVLADADEKIDFVEVDCPYNYYREKRSRSDDADIDNARKLTKLQQWCKERAIGFNLIVNAEPRTEGAKGFHDMTCEYVQQLRRDGIFPDVFIVQSWYKQPAKHLPETERYTFMNTAKDAVALIKKRYPDKAAADNETAVRKEPGSADTVDQLLE